MLVACEQVSDLPIEAIIGGSFFQTKRADLGGEIWEEKGAEDSRI